MDNLKFYEVTNDYINYLTSFAPHLFRNKKQGQVNERKYIGIILEINGFKYFAPLSSYKPKHTTMRESVDFKKIKNYAVININNMFPVPNGEYTYVNISNISDSKYKALLISEYRFIKSMQDKIRKDAKVVYNHKINKDNNTSLAKRCNDFLLLEEACKNYNN